MQNWAITAPIAEKNLGELEGIREYINMHFSEYVESRRRAGVTLERVYLMTTPMGSFVTSYREGRSAAAALHSHLTSGLAFDKWFMGKISALHGINLDQPMVLPEEILSFVEEGVTERKQGIAFCAPVLPGKLDVLKNLVNESMGPRFAELQRSRRNAGLTRDIGFLNRTPNGDFVSVYLEAENAVEANKRWAVSNDPFDVWFRKTAKEATGVDFNQPLPAIRTIQDWRI
jgi:hypothetical protein